MRVLGRILLCLVFWLGPGSVAVLADRVTLKDGRVYEGRFLGVNARGELRMRSGGKILVLPMQSIRSMKRGPLRPNKIAPKPASRPAQPVPRPPEQRHSPEPDAAAEKKRARPPAKPPERPPADPGSDAGTKGRTGPPVVHRPPKGPARTTGLAVLVPGLPQYRAGSKKKGIAFASGFTIALAGSYYFGDRMRRVAQAAASDPSYHLNLNPQPDRDYRTAREGLLLSLGAGLLVYTLHLGDWYYLRIGAGPAVSASDPFAYTFEIQVRF